MPSTLENPPAPPQHAAPDFGDSARLGTTSPAPRNTVILAGVLWVLACAAALGALLLLNHEAPDGPDGTARADRHVLMTYALFAVPTLLVLAGIVALFIGAIRWALYGADGHGVRLAASHHQQTVLHNIQDRMLLSETAKQVAYRVEDITLLRQTIERDIEHRDFDAAMSLVNTLADTYGRIEESEDFRERIESVRTKVQAERLAEQEQKLTDAIEKKDFPRAIALARQAERLFPTVEEVAGWRERVDTARDQHKRNLERAFLQAADRDTDHAMEILKELDMFLTPEEGAQYEEVARGVISKQRENLGVRFKMSVQDRNWKQAMQVGQQIISEFPNTRMADEVRQHMDVIRAKLAALNPANPNALF